MSHVEPVADRGTGACGRLAAQAPAAFRSTSLPRRATINAMNRRRTLLLALPVALVLFGVAWLFWPDSSAINREAFDLIQVGMTRDDVESLLGGPPREDVRGPFLYAKGPWEVAPPKGSQCEFWSTTDFLIGVQFDEDERVKSTCCASVSRAPILLTLRRKLGL